MIRIILIVVLFPLVLSAQGVRSLNAQQQTSQIMVMDTTSRNSFGISSSGGIHTFYFPNTIRTSGGSTFYWSKSGNPTVTDSIRFIQGSNVTLTQSGHTLTIAASGGGGGGSLFEYDSDSDLMPISGSGTDSYWEEDSDLDLQPI